MQAAGAGVYVVGGVPATQASTEDNSNTAGWTLAVVYEKSGLPSRNLTVFVGAEVGGGAGQWLLHASLKHANRTVAGLSDGG